MADTNSSVNNLQLIANMYQQVDNYLEALRDIEDASENNKTNVTDHIYSKQKINDQAYFVLAWGQLEVMIETACRNVIRHGQSQSDWRNNRVWTLYKPDDRRLSGLSFENRLTLVLEKGSENWRKTIQFYKIRNQIAHGKLLLDRIDVSAAIYDFFQIRSALAYE